MWLYLFALVNLLLLGLLLRSILNRKQKDTDEAYKHAVKRLFHNNPEIKDKMKGKIKL